MGPVPALLAQQPTGDLFSWLTGSVVTVLAAVVIAFIRGWIVPGRTHDRALAQNDALAAEVRQLNAIFQEKVIPTLTRATDVIGRAAERERNT